jgi:hypothetical protein
VRKNAKASSSPRAEEYLAVINEALTYVTGEGGLSRMVAMICEVAIASRQWRLVFSGLSKGIPTSF